MFKLKYRRSASNTVMFTLDIIAQVVCVVLLFVLFYQYTGSSNFIVVLKAVLAGALWIFCLARYKYGRKQFILIFCILGYTLAMAIAGSVSFQIFYVYLPLAIYLNKEMDLNRAFWFIMPVLIVAIVAIAWLQSPNNYDLFPDMGRNYVSVFAIYALALFNLPYEKRNRHCPFLAVLIVWLMSVWAVGRGGILSSSVILVLFFVRWALDNKNIDAARRTAKIIFVLALLAVIIVFICTDLDFIKNNVLSRFFAHDASTTMSNNDRMLMITSYVKASLTSARGFFLGSDASLYSVNGVNLHNSYLQVHSELGIVGLLFVVVGAINSIVFLIKKKLLDSLFIFLGFLVRAFTDWCFPTFPCNAILLYYILLPFFYRKKEDAARKEDHSLNGIHGQ